MELHEALSQRVGELLATYGDILVTAESCTGGGIATAITEIAGSSAWFDRAFVTYSNEAKIQMLDVREETLSQWGAVSEPTVLEMAAGALLHSPASLAVAVSGIAGPDGGSVEKPVGTVCFAWKDRSGWEKVATVHFSGSRTQVRSQVVYHALQTIHDYLQHERVSP
ncbi:nicotinamide-nucleotide amidohydrolase family protein [Vibrio rhizosphaerae]|uniref:Nicotinamide-nucleotide amidohydrolase family protein n=1 Tax=Vibrio rhizosphaerae TaxID=398736 RepID=A0ABU4IWM9_9VIBR|nr:nicotinamide-nucleotide amidohydrolase family protein [Vibrio rhizosphaerae]MDW6093804.1 nicotinamide-nucleotide amidohydrolase family protein [Vibrio rhizosphaerae]